MFFCSMFYSHQTTHLSLHIEPQSSTGTLRDVAGRTCFFDLKASGLTLSEVVAAVGTWSEEWPPPNVFTGGVSFPVGFSSARLIGLGGDVTRDDDSNQRNLLVITRNS